jgi:RNA polymerase sigma-70 factor (ECF subfamily)
VTHPSDAELVDRLKRGGDASAFETLYDRHNDSLYASGLRISGDPEMAMDAAHDAWLRAVEGLRAFEGRSAFRTWLTGILINLLRERWRDQRDVLPLDTAGEIATMAPLSTDVDPIDLESAIAALPTRFRAVLVLHDVEGFTHEEIGAMLGVVPGTSKSQLARARQRVRETLTTGAARKLS